MGIIPSHMEQQMGNLKVSKGFVGEGENKLLLYSWDVVEECDRTVCPAARLCSYSPNSQKCPVMLQYLKSSVLILFRNYEETLDEVKLYKLGMHLLPLYRILFRLKLAEVGVRQVVNVNDKGAYSVHPIYREIRETIRTILMVWDSVVGMEKMGGHGRGKELSLTKGLNFNYYEELEREANKKRENKNNGTDAESR